MFFWACLLQGFAEDLGLHGLAAEQALQLADLRLELADAAGGDHVFVGISERTNEAGARQLAAHLATRGLETTPVDVRGIPGLLHLKSGIAWLGGVVGGAARVWPAMPFQSRHG